MSTSQRRNTVTPVSPRQSKKMRTSSTASADEKKVKFADHKPTPGSVLNSSTIKIMGQNAKFASKMSLGKMSSGSKLRHSSDSGIFEEEEDLKPGVKCFKNLFFPRY
jgi:hypothetical protein